MTLFNEHYSKLKASYLFAEIAKRVEAYQKADPQKKIIKLGIGDVTKPLPQVCIDAMHKAVEEMGREETFKGYPPNQGYDFLLEKIQQFDFRSRGVDIDKDEIFLSDGAKCDTANFQELFDLQCRIALPDPVYPVYLDTNVMAGRTGPYTDGRYEGVTYLDCTRENDFVPEPPDLAVDLIYLCFPNNPTGATIDRAKLKTWVDYAKEHRAIILYDAAYVAFIRDSSIVHSIYEIDGAQEVAVEFRSFSKTAGFTGTRCAYTVVPKNCTVYDSQGGTQSLHALWARRQATKFNGVCYPVQRAAEAIYTPQGQTQIRELTDYYLENASEIKKEMTSRGYECVGGENAPYIWIDGKMDSWKFFDLLLHKAGVVCTPGVGFGRCGHRFIRISAFNSHENVEKALNRMTQIL